LYVHKSAGLSGTVQGATPVSEGEPRKIGQSLWAAPAVKQKNESIAHARILKEKTGLPILIWAAYRMDNAQRAAALASSATGVCAIK